MENQLKIQSIGDLITNSSTEVFTIIDEETITSIKNVMTLLGGKKLVERFDFFLDYCEAIDSNAETLVEAIESEYDGKLPEFDSEEDFMKEAILAVVDPRIIQYHYNLVDEKTGETKPFVYSEWDGDSKYLVPVKEIKDQKLKDYLKENLYKLCDDLNGGSSGWSYYPTVCVFPKDQSNTKDKEIASVAMGLPFLCSHTASYC